MGDSLFIGSLFTGMATPVLWLVLFFLLWKTRLAKAVFWIACSIYLITAAIFFALMCAAHGWDGLGYLFLGALAISVYTLLAFIVLLALRDRLNHTKIIAEQNG